MTSNPHYESVRAKIISCCPELMELSNQCKVYAFGHEFGWLTLPYHDNENTFCITWANGEFETLDITGKEFPYEIIGHPIHLSHVLRTTEKFCRDKIKDISFKNLGECIARFSKVEARIVVILSKWNLELDDLAQQDPSVWEALDKMLT